MFRKTMATALFILLLLLSACGKKSQPTIDVNMLNNVQSGILYCFNEDRIFYPTDAETDDVVEHLKQDFSLMQALKAGPQEQPLITFILDTNDNQQLQIAVIKEKEELLLTYTADTNNAADKAYFSLQSTALREYIETLYEEILADPLRW